MPERKTAAKKTRAKKAPTRKPAGRKASKARASRAAVKSPDRKYARRDDYGAPADAFFERQPPALRGHLEALRALVKKAAPAARESLKWGMPYFEMKRGFCALYASDTYAALQILAPPKKLDDPDGRLEGTGRTMRHLKVRTAADIHEPSILGWVKTAAALHS